MKNIKAIPLIFLPLIFLFAGCATAPQIKPGQWALEAPSGKVTTVEVRLLKKNEVYLYAPGHPVSGVYTWDHDLLRISKPDNPRMAGYAWRLHGHVLTLVEETPVPLSGQKLISSQLTRVKTWN